MIRCLGVEVTESGGGGGGGLGLSLILQCCQLSHLILETPDPGLQIRV